MLSTADRASMTDMAAEDSSALFNLNYKLRAQTLASESAKVQNKQVVEADEDLTRDQTNTFDKFVKQVESQQAEVVAFYAGQVKRPIIPKGYCSPTIRKGPI